MILRFTVFLALLILVIEAKKFSEEEHWQEFEEFLKWKKAKEMREDGPRENKYMKRYQENQNVANMNENDQQIPLNPPPIDQAALMARYIVNQAGKNNTFFLL